MNTNQRECLKTIERVYTKYPEAAKCLLSLYEKKVAGVIGDKMERGDDGSYGFTYSSSVSTMLLWRTHDISPLRWGDVHNFNMVSERRLRGI